MDWLRDRWQAASDMSGKPIPGPHWVSIELDAGCAASEALIDWETARADDYELQVRAVCGGSPARAAKAQAKVEGAAARSAAVPSAVVASTATDDGEGQAWTTLTSTRISRTTSERHVVDVVRVEETAAALSITSTTRARLEYRLHIRTPATQWGVSLWRLQLWGSCA